MSKSSNVSSCGSLRTAKIIWGIQSITPLIYTVVVLVLAEQNGGVTQWQGMLGPYVLPEGKQIIYGLWSFVFIMLLSGFYVAQQGRLQLSKLTLNLDQKLRLITRNTSITLLIMDSAAIAALLYALMGGSIWHFLGVIFLVLNCKVSQYPKQ
tara:strand:+ start:9212 stop:9667 length:456 start_codon:yes stop_codon:yes gene_type:complete